MLNFCKLNVIYLCIYKMFSYYFGMFLLGLGFVRIGFVVCKLMISEQHLCITGIYVRTLPALFERRVL